MVFCKIGSVSLSFRYCLHIAGDGVGRRDVKLSGKKKDRIPVIIGGQDVYHLEGFSLSACVTVRCSVKSLMCL